MMNQKIIDSNLNASNKLALLYIDYVHQIFREYSLFPKDGFTPVMVFENGVKLADSYQFALLNKKFFSDTSLDTLKKYNEFFKNHELEMNTLLSLNINNETIAICPNEALSEKKKLVALLSSILPNEWQTYNVFMEKEHLQKNLSSSIDNQHTKIKI